MTYIKVWESVKLIHTKVGHPHEISWFKAWVRACGGLPHLCSWAKTSSSTYVAEVFIQQLDISVQHLEGQQLIILVLQTSTEVQAGIPAGKRSNVTARVGPILWKQSTFDRILRKTCSYDCMEVLGLNVFKKKEGFICKKHILIFIYLLFSGPIKQI